MEEVWTTFKECPHFKISNTGRLINTRTNHERKLSMQSSGYLGFTLFRGTKSYAMHRSVAEHFLIKEDSDEKLIVNHKDGNKLNNNVSNLEWVTKSENIRHAINNGLIHIGEKRYGAKLNKYKVLQIKKMSLSGMSYSGIAKKYDLAPATIRNIVLGKKWKHITL